MLEKITQDCLSIVECKYLHFLSMSNTVGCYMLEAVFLVSCAHIHNSVHILYKVLLSIKYLVEAHKLAGFVREHHTKEAIGSSWLSFLSLIYQNGQPQNRYFYTTVVTVGKVAKVVYTEGYGWTRLL